MATAVHVGIDVSKDKVDVSCRGGAARVAGTWKRTDSQLQKLATELVACGVCRVVLEASGGYERAVLLALFEAGVDVVMVQPSRARHFAKSLGRYAKTDAIDAAVLALMAEVAVDDVPSWKPRHQDVQQLRALVQRRDQVLGHIDAETKRLKQANENYVQKSIDRVLSLLHEERRELESRISALCKRSEQIATGYQQLKSVRGVGLITAAVLIAEVPELGTLGRNQVAALVGVAPMTRESGKWSGHRYTVGGRTRARNALYMAALSATRWNGHLREFYQRLVARGKAKKLALVAVMRKLIIHLNALMRPAKDISLAA